MFAIAGLAVLGGAECEDEPRRAIVDGLSPIGVLTAATGSRTSAAA
jgi:hypothetical protein